MYDLLELEELSNIKYEWVDHVYLGKETDLELSLGSDHNPLTLNPGRIYRYLEDKI